MSVAKFRIRYETAFKCRCGRWLAHPGQDCAVCALRKETKDAPAVRRRLRAKLDPGANYDEHGRPTL